MPILEGGRIIEGTYGPIHNAGAPGAGTNEVQTLTIGGTPTAGTFKLVLDGVKTGAITWSATNATLLANINTALDAAFGASQIVATDSTLTAGIGDLLLTFSGSEFSKKVVNTMSYESSLTGTAPTLAIAETTAGVNATARGLAAGGLVIDTTNKKLYVNTGTPNSPTFTVVGSQS